MPWEGCFQILLKMFRVPLIEFMTSNKIQLINQMEKLNSKGQYILLKHKPYQRAERRREYTNNVYVFIRYNEYLKIYIQSDVYNSWLMKRVTKKRLLVN